MKIFVTGATGYIGSAVAQAFRRAGHEVWGLTRGPEKAAALAREEIHPVIGSLQEPDGWRAVAAEAAVLVHAAADHQTDTAALDEATVEALIALAGDGARPKTLLYTSGVWVHGADQGERVDETTPPRPISLVRHRPALEQRVIGAAGLRGNVIRPGMVFGRRAGLTGMWFAGARDGELKVIGDGRNRWATVHVDDLADLYLRVAEQGLAGEILNGVDASRDTVAEMVQAIAAASGYRGEIRYIPLQQARQTLGDFADGLALDQHVDGGKARRLLGWQPRHNGLAAEAGLYWEAWRNA